MRAPALAIGDGALGFWAAVRDVWPETRAQRARVHRIANVLDKLPKRLQPKAKAALKDIMKPSYARAFRSMTASASKATIRRSSNRTRRWPPDHPNPQLLTIPPVAHRVIRPS